MTEEAEKPQVKQPPTLLGVLERLVVPAITVSVFVGGIWTNSVTTARRDTLLQARVEAVEKELDRRAPIFDLVATIDNRQHENRTLIDGLEGDVVDIKSSVHDLVLALSETNKTMNRLAGILISRQKPLLDER